MGGNYALVASSYVIFAAAFWQRRRRGRHDHILEDKSEIRPSFLYDNITTAVISCIESGGARKFAFSRRGKSRELEFVLWATLGQRGKQCQTHPVWTVLYFFLQRFQKMAYSYGKDRTTYVFFCRPRELWSIPCRRKSLSRICTVFVQSVPNKQTVFSCSRIYLFFILSSTLVLSRDNNAFLPKKKF